ncbi:MAG: S9 family peptidase [Bacteroidales bacterium]|nr:S9 family peptidase [Candidatus Cryptobacteroides equifaecalis]
MKKFIRIVLVVAVCFGIGYAIGFAFSKFMKRGEDKGYIGPSDVKVESGVMTPEVLLSLGRLSDPQLSPDGSLILYGVSYTSVAENRSCRNLFVCNADGSDRVQISKFGKSVSNARWSKDGKHIYFLQGGQLWKAAFKGNRLGRKTRVSDVPAGISDYKISPDASQIMYVSTIPGPVKSPKDSDPALDKAQAYVADGLMYRHWDHWVTETPRTFVAALNGNVITPDNSFDILSESEVYELPTEPFGGVEQLSWAPDSRHIAYSCRKKMGIEYAFSTNTSIYVYDIVTGETVPVTTEGGYDTNPSFSADGKWLAWISMERDGYEADRQRLMVAAVTGVSGDCDPADGQSNAFGISEVRELTEDFEYDVADIFWTPDNRNIVFPVTIDAIGALCSVNVEGDTEIVRLTPSDWWYGFGTPFGYEQDEKGIRIYTSYNSMSFPTELALVRLPGSSESEEDDITPDVVSLTSENGDILSQVDEITTEQIVLKTAQGEDLYCWVLYPPHFDPNGTYAGVEMFNGGPQTSLDQGWSYRWNFFMMAQQGYVVILPNRHGDSGFGQAWKEQISGDYQGLNMEDYQIAGRWFKSQPWAGKLAGVGASYGGFSVYNMMGIHGDLYDCFISHAGIFDEKAMWYTTEEVWFANWDNGGLTPYAYEPGQTGPKGDGITFGGMQQAGAPYSNVAKVHYHYANDPESRVTKWHTPILCIHGMMDFRIPYEQGMAAFNAAQMMGVPSRLVIFPEENHWILQPQNALFWHREFFDWLEKWLSE